ncbi:hypothetical protein BKA00_007444 [Actinomadura coerulea]|uniref:Uncharacterized protein n=1 Tax=Actinomadura coerulea TaxID=46159 RepID=A0A7X0L3E8_9ACTN|nr:hypothetical protein [Actinomadura coerulea]MBB6400530.1 hypothetical protein [Actinomadura coerulea]
MSRLRIFETDPDAKPKPREGSDIVGRFRSGMMDGRTPVSLSEWRVTTGDPDVAAYVAEKFGGSPEEWETESEENLQVLTSASKVRVIIDGPDAISSDMRLYGMNGQIIHHCDGVEYLSPEEDAGEPCGCPKLFAERKALAKSGRGPKPATRIVFTLADAPHLGKFAMGSGSWDLVRVLHEYENKIEDVRDDHDGASALCTLALENVEFVPKGGPMKGKTVSYMKPTLTVHGPAAKDAAEGTVTV